MIAGLYGLAHDQITYSLGYEYFTEFKFHQFHYLDQSLPERVLVAQIGFLATWWVGMFSGWFMGRITIPYLPLPQAARLCAQGMVYMMLVAVIFALTAYGVAPKKAEAPRMAYWQAWLLPNDVIDGVAFVQVGYIHNASYLGGLVGLIGVLFWLRRRRQQLRISL